MKHRRPRAGVTLLELLLAVTLVSLISVGLLMAMRIGMNAMGRTNTRLMQNRRVLGAQRILQEQLAGFMPVSAICIAAPGQPPAGEVRFFQGEPQSMRFVSSYSIQEAGRGRPQVLELQVIPGENRQGVRLVVNEWPYSGPASAGRTCLGVVFDQSSPGGGLQFRPIEPGPSSFVLADKLASCRFVYRQAPDPSAPEAWLPRWPRMDRWPSAVRVELLPLESDPVHSQIMPVTVALKSDRDPLKLYEDQQR